MKKTTFRWILLATLVGCQTGPSRRTPAPTPLVGSAGAPKAPAAPADPVAQPAATTTGEQSNPPTSEGASPDQTTSGGGTKKASSPIVLTAAQKPTESPPDPPSDQAQAESVPTPARQSAGPPPADPAAQAELSLSDALATGLSQNPDLITIRGTANVGAAVIDVARVYPWNPFVQAQFLPQGHPFVPASSPGSQAGGANYYVWLMQRFELGHQRRYREEGAIAAFGQTRWNIRQAELLNVTQTERLFFTALYQRQLRDLAYDGETLGRQLLEVVQRRFQAGIATAVEIANARVAARQSHRQLQLAEAAYQAALLALRQQLGLPAGAPLNLSGDLTEYQWQPVADVFCWLSQSAAIDPTMLAMEVAEARPDVMAARSAAAIARANLNLARAARTPDVQAGPIYSTADNGTNFLGFRVQRDLAIFNNGTALASQRETELRQQFLAHAQLARRATNEAASAIDRYERARRFVAENAAADGSTAGELQQVLAQFEAGKADIVSVLGIQNNLLSEQRAELDLVNELAQAAAQVTQSTGIPPERLLAPPRPEPLPSPVEPPEAPAP